MFDDVVFLLPEALSQSKYSLKKYSYKIDDVYNGCNKNTMNFSFYDIITTKIDEQTVWKIK